MKLKKALLIWCSVFLVGGAMGQEVESPLGPLGAANNAVNDSGFHQFYVAMENGIRDLGTDGFIRVLWQNGMVSPIPTEATPIAVNKQRYDRLLSPRNKNSLYRMVGQEVIRNALRKTPPTIPNDPLIVSVFVATASDTFNANRSAQIRAKIDSIQTPIDLSE